MKLKNTTTVAVTFEQWSERIKSFMTANQNRIKLTQSQLAQDLKACINVDITSILNGFVAQVSYVQLVHYIANQGNIDLILAANSELDENGTPEEVPEPIESYTEREIFNYTHIADIQTTNAMLDSVESFVPVEVTGLDRIRAKVKILVLGDIVQNNVFGLNYADWEQIEA